MRSAHFSARLPRVTVVTHSPSPYQVELFNEVASQARLDLHVVYLYERDQQRLWKKEIPLHRGTLLSDHDTDTEALLRSTDEADLLVLNYYKHPFAKDVLQRRKRLGKPMCFWGERPLIHWGSPVSKFLRQWRLRAIRQTRSPVWGIGAMAVSAYRREFGPHHEYANLPYFSNLARFQDAPRKPPSKERVFLYSGTLCHRKGTDLLTKAFLKLAAEYENVHLRIVGYGPMEAAMKEQLSSVASRVDFTGFCPWDQLHLQYAQRDILCAPSRHDGWGLVVPEGLSAGLPVISTTQTGAAVEFIRPGVNGWLAPPGDDAVLYESMRRAAALTAEQWHEMSRQARESVAQHTLDRGASRFIEAALTAIGNQSTPPSKKLAGQA